MHHAKTGSKLGRSSSHKEAMLRNMVTSVIKHERIRTTDSKAKELRKVAEKMELPWAKKAACTRGVRLWLLYGIKIWSVNFSVNWPNVTVTVQADTRELSKPDIGLVTMRLFPFWNLFPMRKRRKKQNPVERFLNNVTEQDACPTVLSCKHPKG